MSLISQFSSLKIDEPNHVDEVVNTVQWFQNNTVYVSFRMISSFMPLTLSGDLL